MITRVRLIDISITSPVTMVCVLRFKIYPASKLQVYNAVLLTLLPCCTSDFQKCL